jgi:uncharacterized protein YbjT (DUF2867 family)
MILVTGAGGSNGSELTKRLSAKSASVRAMVRKSSSLESNALPGVEFVTADFDDLASVNRALEGVQSACLVTNSSQRTETQQLRFVETARAADLRHIVYLSQLHARKDSPVRFLRYHAVVEEAIAASGMTFTILRPNLYMQGLLEFRASIISEGRFFAAAGDSRVSIVDVRDIAAVAATALTESRHEGKTYDVTGPEALTHADMASQLSETLGRRISFVDLSEVAMRDALLSLGMPEWQIDGLIEDYAHYRRGEASVISTIVEDVTGFRPRSFLAFTRDYKQAFSQ